MLRSQSQCKEGGRDGYSPTLAVVVALVLVLAVVVWADRHRARARSAPQGSGPRRREGMDVTPSALMPEGRPERCSVYAAASRLYSTADVDPLISGAAHQYSDGVRNVYAERTSHGDLHGLTEYSSAGGPGDVGVDVGPIGLEGYGGEQVGYDDGIPPNWAFPSTPVHWYQPKQRDFYGPEGATVYSEGLYPLSEPDHDALVG